MGAARTASPAYDPRADGGVLQNLVVREGRADRSGPDPSRDRSGKHRQAARRPPHGRQGLGRRGRRPGRSARSACPRSWPGFDCRSLRPPSFRPTPRWPSDSAGSRATTRALWHASASSTSTAGSGRSGSPSRRGPARCGESRSVPEAVADAERNAARQRDRQRSIRGRRRPPRASARCSSEPADPTSWSSIPPRAGLSKKVVRRVIECDARRIVYVSCNPTTLAPNAAQLVGGRLYAAAREAGRHVSADPARRVRRAAGEGVTGQARGFGVAAGLDPAVAAPLAARCAELGYSSIWSNDHPGAQGLETARRRSPRAPTELELGVAVIALDRHGPAEIDAEIERLGLDRDRLWIGVGAGFSDEAPDRDARGAAGASRGAARSAARPGRDGAEDVRPGRRRIRRRVLQLDDPRASRPAPASRSMREHARPAASRPPSSATSAPRSATTPRSGWPRRSPSTATSTTATGTTSRASASRGNGRRRRRRPGTAVPAARRLRGARHRRRPGPGQRQRRGDGRRRRGRGSGLRALDESRYRSVRRQVLVPLAERPEGAPEALLGAPPRRASRRCRACRARRRSG